MVLPCTSITCLPGGAQPGRLALQPHRMAYAPEIHEPPGRWMQRLLKQWSVWFAS